MHCTLGRMLLTHSQSPHSLPWDLDSEDAIKKEVQGVKRSSVRGPFQCHILLYISCRDCRHNCRHALEDGRNGGREVVKEQSRTGETSESDVREGG